MQLMGHTYSYSEPPCLHHFKAKLNIFEGEGDLNEEMSKLVKRHNSINSTLMYLSTLMGIDLRSEELT